VHNPVPLSARSCLNFSLKYEVSPLIFVGLESISSFFIVFVLSFTIPASNFAAASGIYVNPYVIPVVYVICNTSTVYVNPYLPVLN